MSEQDVAASGARQLRLDLTWSTHVHRLPSSNQSNLDHTVLSKQGLSNSSSPIIEDSETFNSKTTEPRKISSRESPKDTDSLAMLMEELVPVELAEERISSQEYSIIPDKASTSPSSVIHSPLPLGIQINPDPSISSGSPESYPMPQASHEFSPNSQPLMDEKNINSIATNEPHMDETIIYQNNCPLQTPQNSMEKGKEVGMTNVPREEKTLKEKSLEPDPQPIPQKKESEKKEPQKIRLVKGEGFQASSFSSIPPSFIDAIENQKTSQLDVRPSQQLHIHSTHKLRPITTEIHEGSFGEKLRKARELNDLSIAEVAEKTKINSEFIQLLEEENFQRLSLAPIYVKSYLKALARCYNIDATVLLEDYRRIQEANSKKDSGSTSEKTLYENPSSIRTEEEEKKIQSLRWIISSAAAALILLFFGSILYMNYTRTRLRDEALSSIRTEELQLYVLPETIQFKRLEIPSSPSPRTVR